MYARKSVALGEENSNRDTLGIIIESATQDDFPLVIQTTIMVVVTFVMYSAGIKQLV